MQCCGISYRRGLTGVAYPCKQAVREPESRDKHNRVPRFSFMAAYWSFFRLYGDFQGTNGLLCTLVV